jgi:dienelactone hydrolase
VIETSVRVAADGVALDGDLAMPDGARSVVVFAHGSGSGRHSPRNRTVAASLQRRGIATFLMDLLTADEERVDARTRQLRFDIGLLAGRLERAADWLLAQPAASGCALGYFGASTGAAAALAAAARHPEHAGAIVSRGGRPDLAGPLLPRVRAPTLLIVGGLDRQVIELNREAYAGMTCEREVTIVPGATHLFEEAGTLETVARLAGEWFERYLVSTDVRSPA